MSLIIAGRVETLERAEQAAMALRELGLNSTDVQVFYVNPPGQHGTFPLGGDVFKDPGAKSSSSGQAAGAGMGAIAGAAVGAAAAAVAAPIVAPAVLVGLTAAGAHVGGLAGAVATTRDAEEEAASSPSEKVDTRRGGMMIAACVPSGKEETVIEALRQVGTEDIERAEGRWENGNWVDFNPLAPPKRVDAELSSSDQ